MRKHCLAIFVLAFLSQGCMAYMSTNSTDQRFKEIAWREDFDVAVKDAKAKQKPILLVAAAGDLTGFC